MSECNDYLQAYDKVSPAISDAAKTASPFVKGAAKTAGDIAGPIFRGVKPLVTVSVHVVLTKGFQEKPCRSTQDVCNPSSFCSC